ncbi:MAG: c-type cytochrome [Cyclobacteriaceae bacterium]|nr:c-type cytochrome [Cyclobacteriaceae bacterium]
MEFLIKMTKSILFTVGIMAVTLSFNLAEAQSVSGLEKWVAPPAADKEENQYTSSKDLESGKQVFDMYCWVCHGKEGLGDGPAGASLPVKPKNFTEASVKEQTDGALFWKLTNGRGNMIGYGSILTEEKRWQLVSYIRSLNENFNKTSSN